MQKPSDQQGCSGTSQKKWTLPTSRELNLERLCRGASEEPTEEHTKSQEGKVS